MKMADSSYAWESIRNHVEIIVEDSGFAHDVVVAKYRRVASHYLADFVADNIPYDGTFLDKVTSLIEIRLKAEDYTTELAAFALAKYIDALEYWKVTVTQAMWNALVEAMFDVAHDLTKQLDAWIESQIRLQV